MHAFMHVCMHSWSKYVVQLQRGAFSTGAGEPESERGKDQRTGAAGGAGWGCGRLTLPRRKEIQWLKEQLHAIAFLQAAVGEFHAGECADSFLSA